MDLNEDALSDVLRTVHLKTCIYFVRDMAAPWGMDIPVTANGPLHMVLDGSCTVRHGQEEYSLQAGDAIILPHGAHHQMLDDPATLPQPGSVMMQNLLNEDYAPPARSATRMLCGHFEWDSSFDHPLFRELPELMIVRGTFSSANAERFRSIINLIAMESGGSAPGGAAIADRMGEVLLVCMLRSWLLENLPDKGVLATIQDSKLSRALRHIHQHPELDLDLNELARVAGMSRTSFAVKFKSVMGKPPAAYLNEWRMLTARRILLLTSSPTYDTAVQVGYGSEAAFNRAFKRRFGDTPGKFRRNSRRSGAESVRDKSES